MMNPLVKKQTLVSPIAEDVFVGLNREDKSLPPRLFYDAMGSQLFEQITELPEYYLTRTERWIFEHHATEMIAAARTGSSEHKTGENLTVIELGAGTAAKTKVLIDALLAKQFSATFYPIDVSESALEIAEESLKAEFPQLKVRPLLGDYSDGLAQIANTAEKKLVLYIGSSVGNFEPKEASALLRNIRTSLRPGDALLLGVDLVKSQELLHAAYNDSQGVTAQFNLNILVRINRELGADFDISSFLHVAEWNPRGSRMEIYVQSMRAQSVWIADLGTEVHLRLGERIHTENSYKFTDDMVKDMLMEGGFTPERSWTDPKAWFGVYLARF